MGIYRCVAKLPDGKECDTLFYVPKKGVRMFEQRFRGSLL